MVLTNLALQNFRSFKKQSFDFSPQATLILGPNTSGKTNILEAIYLLATGRSFRAEVEREMIGYQEEIARVGAEVGTKMADFVPPRASTIAETTNLEIILTAGQISGQLVPHKKYLVNGVSKRMIDFVGNLRAVLFWPEDLELVTNSPSVRRKYLDLVLTQVDREYRRSLLSYEKGLRQRNKLLECIRDENVSRSQLLFWNQLLIRNGALLTDKRREFIDFINSFQGEKSQYQMEYDKSVISETRLEQYTQEEIAAAVTLVGPHRDDFLIRIYPYGRDISIYGSRGEQRMAILWLKLAELEFVSQQTGQRPILLLDDIFSEFDHEHRRHVLKVIPEQQTIMTTTDLHLIEKEFVKKVQIIRL